MAIEMTNVGRFQKMAEHLAHGRFVHPYWLLLEGVKTKPHKLAARSLHFHAWVVSRYDVATADAWTESLIEMAQDSTCGNRRAHFR